MFYRWGVENTVVVLAKNREQCHYISWTQRTLLLYRRGIENSAVLLAKSLRIIQAYTERLLSVPLLHLSVNQHLLTGMTIAGLKLEYEMTCGPEGVWMRCSSWN